MHNYIMQYRTTDTRWVGLGTVRARSLSSAIRNVAARLSDITNVDALEISACLDDAPREVKPVVEYMGDVDPAQGGYFFRADQLEFGASVDVVRITPMSDAGGPDNMFWVDELHVFLPDVPDHADYADDIRRVLHYVGKENWQPGDALEPALLMDAKINNGDVDQVSSVGVQVGKDDVFFARTAMHGDTFTASVRLPGNALIGNYARKILIGMA